MSRCSERPGSSKASRRNTPNRPDIFENDYPEGSNETGEENRYRNHRYLIADLFNSNRSPRNENDRATSPLRAEVKPRPEDSSVVEENEEEFDADDYSWIWDTDNKSSDVLVQNNSREVYFHPDYSCGTAAIRGKRQLNEGEEHYWEIKMSSAVYGTDMMIGVGASTVDLNKYKSQFCSIIGKDTDSWGISYFGTLHHNGKTKEYTRKFERGSIIGCHLDLWKGTLSFYKNGEPLGIAFDGLLGKKLYPLISSTAARTKMKLLCSYNTNFSLQYLCCKQISENMNLYGESVANLPIPKGLKRYLSWRMDWVLKLNNPGLKGGFAPKRKKVKRKEKVSRDLNNNTSE